MQCLNLVARFWCIAVKSRQHWLNNEHLVQSSVFFLHIVIFTLLKGNVPFF